MNANNRRNFFKKSGLLTLEAIPGIKYLHLTALFLLFFTTILLAQNKTLPGKFIIEPPTLISLGFEWYIDGDDNRNATVEVYYRESGGNECRSFLPLLRIGNEKCGTPEWNYTTENMFAGSIFDLKPHTEYECRLVIKDPDGLDGESEKRLTVKTRAKPDISNSGNMRHVYPENWKGRREEPSYNGLLHAYYGYPRFADWILTTDPVQPGDIIGPK